MNVGPQAQRTTSAARAWAKRAPIVKQVGSTELFLDARPDAWRIFRWRFKQQLLTKPQSAFDQIVQALNGYRHEKLLVEIYNELSPVSIEAQIRFYLKIVPMFAALGIKTIGPCWGTGDYERRDWERFRAANWCGFFAIAVHAYWADATPQFTRWNALRWREYYDPVLDGARLVVVCECGRDRIRDGPNNTYIGKGGYLNDKVAVPVYAGELNRFAKQLLPHEYATPFVCGPEADQLAYDLDPVAALIDVEEDPVPTPPPAFEVGTGLQKAAPWIGPFVESQSYDAPGTDREVAKIATPRGYACWCKATNETLVYCTDGRILVDNGNHASGQLRELRGPFRPAP